MPERPRIVIVGAGASGLFAALRLVDLADVTLIEAGRDAGDPAPDWLLGDFSFAPDRDWGYHDTATGQPLLRGKVTGGSTSVNSAAALRGQPGDYDEWGSELWSWAAVAADFAAIESDAQYGDRPGHGDDGPLPITRLPFGTIDDGFAAWAQSRGHAWVDDHNAPGVLGVGPWPSNMLADGSRWGAHAALLPGLRDRITLLSETEVLRVDIVDGRARGVIVRDGDGERLIEADHVVLSAGSVNSPVLLMRSGIGPRDALVAAGVDVVRNAPGVGANLQDHPWTVLQLAATDQDAAGQRPINGVLLRYEVSPDDRTEVHLYPHQALPYFPDSDPADVLVGIGLMRAVSRGRVTIGPDQTVQVERRHLDDPRDAAAIRQVLDDAIAYIDDMVATGVLVEPASPWWRRDDLDAALLENLDSYGHLVGTARLGRADDPDAVVDDRLSVIGIDGLSVIDASVMPVSPRANTMLASMVVGWRGAGLLAERLGISATASTATSTAATSSTALTANGRYPE